MENFTKKRAVLVNSDRRHRIRSLRRRSLFRTIATLSILIIAQILKLCRFNFVLFWKFKLTQKEYEIVVVIKRNLN